MSKVMPRGGSSSCCCCFVTWLVVASLLYTLSFIFYIVGFLIKENTVIEKVSIMYATIYFMNLTVKFMKRFYFSFVVAGR